MDFEDRKQRALLRYKDKKEAGLIDKDCLELNQIINSIDNIFTTSSCAGRFTLIAKEQVNDKYNTTFHFTTHSIDEISVDTFTEIQFDHTLWVMLEAMNYHIRTKDLDTARWLHQTSLKADLGYSKFQSIGPKIIVEVLGTSRLATPIGRDNNIFLTSSHKQLIVEEAKQLLKIERERMEKWKNILRQ